MFTRIGNSWGERKFNGVNQQNFQIVKLNYYTAITYLSAKGQYGIVNIFYDNL